MSRRSRNGRARPTGRRSPIFEKGDIVRIPFPYVERDRREARPALILSARALGPKPDLLWAIMITSAANRGWPGDVSLEERYAECGLPAPSLIRTEKIATLEASSAEKIGRLPADLLRQVDERIGGYLGIGAGA